MKYFILPLFILFISCGEETTSTNEKVKSDQQKETIEISKSEISDACELITQDEIQKNFNPESEVQNKNSGRNFPTCVYKWKSSQKIEKEIAGNIISYDGENVITIVLGSSKANDNQFKQATSVYEDAEEVSIADKALWSEKMHQLTMMHSKFLIHVNVEFYDQKNMNKEKAMALADIILSKL